MKFVFAPAFSSRIALLGVMLCILGGSVRGQSGGAQVYSWKGQFGQGRLQGAVLSPDGLYVATYGTRGVFMRSATNGVLIRVFQSAVEWVQCAAFSPDGATLATGGDDGVAKLWSVADGSLIQSFRGHSDTIWDVAFSRDGSRILSGSEDGTARLWSAVSGNVLKVFKGHTNGVWSVAFSPDGTRALTGGSDHTARVWSLATGSQVLTCQGHTDAVTDVAFSLDGAWLATGSWDGTAILWAATNAAKLRQFIGHGDEVTSVAFSPDGQKILTASWDNTARLWASGTGTALQTYSGHSNGVFTAVFGPGGTNVLTASADNTARIWSVTNGQTTLTLRGHTDGIWDVAFSPDGTKVLTANWDKTASLWDRATSTLLQTFTGHSDDVMSATFSPDGNTVLTGSMDNTAKLWTATNGALLRTFSGHTRGVWRAAFSPDGAKVLTGSADGTARLWSVGDGATLKIFTGHSNDVMSVAFSPDGARVLTGGADDTAKLWSTNGGAALQTFTGHTHYVRSVAFSPDGATVLTGSWDGTAKLWSTNGGSLIWTFAGHSDGIWSVAFSPDGYNILTGSADLTAMLWSLEDGAVLSTFIGHTHDVSSVAFSRDGMWLLTGGWDGTALLWSPAQGSSISILTPGTLPTATVGSAYSLVLQAIGGTEPYVWSVVSGSLPSGLALGSSGLISGVGTQFGASQFAVRVTDALGMVATNFMQLTVQESKIVVTTQPVNAVATVGGTASFSVAALGADSLSYQWQFNGTNLVDNVRVSGSRTNVLNIVGILMSDAGSYSVIVSNALGATNSQSARLDVVKPAPTLTWTNPASITYGTALGSNQMNASASVPGAFFYAPVVGSVLNAGNNTLFVTFVPTDTNTYNSANATVSLIVTPVPLGISANNASRPQGQTNPVFSGVMTGLRNNDNIIATYSCAATTVSLPGDYQIVPSPVDPNSRLGNYQLSLTNGTLTVTAIPPQIVAQPTNQMVVAGSNATFFVTAIGSPPLAYQWRFNSTNIVNATNSVFQISNAQISNAGNYTVLVTNAYGSQTSSVAVLTVTTPDTTPPVISQISMTPGLTGCDLSWSTDESATAVVEYGPTLSFGWTNQFTAAFALNHLVSLTGLNPGTTYFFRVRSADASGNMASYGSNNTTFVTAQTADLVVTNLSTTAAPAFQSGAQVIVQWQDANAGGAAVNRSFIERIQVRNTTTLEWLVDATQTFDPRVPGLAPIGPGQVQSRGFAFALPNGARGAGALSITVTVDSANDIFESNAGGTGEANNTASLTRSSVLSLYPDLVVTNVIAPATGLPGGDIAVMWTVENLGNTNAGGGWSEQVFLVDPTTSSNSTLLGTFAFTNILAPGQTITRTETVQAPVFAGGTFRVGVWVDSGNDVVEPIKTNNYSEAAQPLTLAPALTLTFSSETVAKSVGTNAFNAILTRSSVSSNALVVTLDCAQALRLNLPVSVTIPAGQVAVVFPVSVLNDHLMNGDQLQTVEALAAGWQSAQAEVLVTDDTAPALTLALSVNQFSEGSVFPAAQGTVVRNGGTNVPLEVFLLSDKPARATVSSSVTISAGQYAAVFTIAAVENNVVDGAATVTISAMASSYAPASATVVVLDNDIQNLSLVLNPSTVVEGAASPAALASITRAIVTDQADVVRLSSSDPAGVVVPWEVVIAANDTSVTFPVNVPDNNTVDGIRNVAITARLVRGGAAVLDGAASATLKVLDNDGPTLTLSMAASVAAVNGSVATTVHRNTSISSNLVVTLTCSDASQVSAPATVTIPAGQTDASFTVTRVAGGIALGSQLVTITAGASGFNSGFASLALSAVSQPDLVVSSIAVPSDGFAGATVPVTWSVANKGNGAAGGSWIDRIYLSSDNQVGNDTLVATVAYNGTLDAGQSYVKTCQVTLTQTVGPVWIIVVTDSDNAVAEAVENNNTGVSASPIAVVAPYTATVQTDVKVSTNGAPIPLHGLATDILSGQPTAGKLVSVHVLVRGTERVVQATTGANGTFQITFQPQQNEGGYYETWAAYPGVSSATSQDSFWILRMKATPSSASIALSPNVAFTQTLALENLADVPLSGLSVEILGASAGLDAHAAVTNTLGPLQTVPLTFALTALDNVPGQGRLIVRVTSREGVALYIPLDVQVVPFTPQLASTPGYLNIGMLVGAQRAVQFDVRNNGSAASGDLSVRLPNVSWMSLATTPVISSLEPGAKTSVTLLLSPPASLALGQYNASIALRSTLTELLVPLQLRVTSDALGSVHVTVVDDYTYHVQGAPKVGGATVRLRDPYDQSLVLTEGLTDTNGVALFPTVAEGSYILEVQCAKHATVRQTISVTSGATNDFELFSARQIITYQWTVVPTSIEDNYQIVMQPVFEVNVPVPVVTIELPPVLPVIGPGETAQIDVTLVNHGLIAANDSTLKLPEHPQYLFQTLSTNIGVIPAKSAITVPVIVQGVDAQTQSLRATPKMSSTSTCDVYFQLAYDYECGPDHIWRLVYARIPLGETDCSSGGGSGGVPAPGADITDRVGGWGAGFTQQQWQALGVGSQALLDVAMVPIEKYVVSCDPCLLAKIQAAKKCVKSFKEVVENVPVEVVTNFFEDVECVIGQYEFFNQVFTDDNTVAQNVAAWAKANWGCANIFIRSKYKVVRTIYKSIKHVIEVESCMEEWPKCRIGSSPAQGANAAKLSASVRAGEPLGIQKSSILVQDKQDAAAQSVVDQINRLDTWRAWAEMMIGGDSWFEDQTNHTVEAWIQAFNDRIQDASDQGVKISAGERAELLTTYLPDTVSVAEGGDAIDRWNRTMDYWQAHIFAVEDVPAGQSTNFIPVALWVGTVSNLVAATDASKAEGSADLVDGLSRAVQALDDSTQPDSGVCAKVKLEIDQNAVLTRTVFAGTLEVENGSGTSPIQGLRVTLDIRDDSGADAQSRFVVKGPDLEEMTAVDGTGMIGAGSTGIARFTFIPTRDAAALQPTSYKIGGTLRYLDPDSGLEVLLPLYPSSITVYPEANLVLKYFMQRDVYGDDPFTEDVVEPSEPFSLGLLAQNTGGGMAHNFHITSAQPKIIDNKKGLLIDFKIIGSQVGSNVVAPSLTVDLGDIDSGQSQVARWLFTSSLQGKFIEYSASFEHSDQLGGKRTSLIDRTEIHELIHVVRDDRPGADGLMDFLANDVPDPDNLPDTLHLSDGTVAVVSAVTKGVADGTVTLSSRQIHITAAMPARWSYLQIPDPGPGYQLYRVVRSDGKEIRVDDNAWNTDRSFPASQTGVRRENLLHLLDFNSTGSYTLYYRVNDFVPPVLLAIQAPAATAAAVDSVDVVFSKTIDLSTFDYQDMQLTLNNGANLISSAVVISQTASNVYHLSGLSGVTTSDGNYALTVSGTGILDYAGNACQNSLTAQWAKGTAAPVISQIAGINSALVNTPVDHLDLVFTKPLNPVLLDRTALLLTLNGGASLVNSSITVAQISSTRFRVIGLAGLTAAQGHYVFTVLGSHVTDLDGNLGIGSLAVDWTLDNTGPSVVSLENPVPNIRNMLVPSLDVEFSEAITAGSFDYRSVNLARNGGANLVTAQIQIVPLGGNLFRIGHLDLITGQDGTYSLTISAASVLDLVGNAGRGFATTTWTMDATKPLAPTNLTVFPDTGAVTNDNILNVTNCIILGRVNETNLTVRLLDNDSGALLGSTNCSGLSFVIPVSLSRDGARRVVAQAVDQAGNVSANSYLDLFVDLVPPVASFVSVSPNPRSTPVSQVEVDFSESIAPGFDYRSVVMTRDGGSNLISGATQVQRITDTTCIISGLTGLTAGVGNYQLSLLPDGISDIAGNALFTPATLSWQFVAVPPSISAQPQSLTNLAGTASGFSVSATGTEPLGYQWRFNGVNLAGATATNYIVAGAQPTNAGNYDVVVTNVAGGITSAVASLTVWVPPTITTQPQSQTVFEGSNVTFSITATGTAPLNYQWSFWGVDMASKTNNSLTLTGVQTNQAGSYRVQISNAAGATTSAVATLAVQYLRNYVFANTNLIRIRDINTAIPYPSAIVVSNLVGTVSKTTATFSLLTHTYTSDIDALLVGPQGQTTMLMAEAGVYGAFGETFTFDDDATNYLPSEDYLISGTFKPTFYPDPYPTNNTMPPPAPAGPYGLVLSTFNGIDPNGLWSLFVRDDFRKELGQIAGGWRLCLRILNVATGSTAPATRLVLISVWFSPNGSFQFGVLGETGKLYHIQTSTNLLDWSEWTTLTATNPFVTLSVPVTNKSRFFRAVGGQ